VYPLVPNSSTSALSATTNINPDASPAIPLPTSGDALISYTGPAGTLTDVIETPQTDRISVYVVRKGDTLSDIARMYNVSVNTVIWANNLKGVKDVHEGDTLIILPISGVKRTVAKGDTFKSLAKAYGADANEIAQFNGLDPAAGLAIGSTIIIPGGEVVAPAAPKKATGSTKLVGGSTKAALPATSGYFTNPAPGSHRTQGLHGHNGVDLGKAPGAVIVAAADGTVIIARNGGWNGGYGNYVVVSHANGTQTLYAHLSTTIVAPGQSVAQGQTIGYMGSTGKSTGTHLHFEVRGAANPFTR
jgi:LysM repeat protein